jgi:serine/threonine protein kinase
MAHTDFMDAPAIRDVAAMPVAQEPKAMVGCRVGTYQIVEQLGMGGMGEVYRAFRADDQYRKEVAIKLVRAGQDSAFVVSRFKNERQTLANLDHPNIARLLDGGSTEEGVPYFVITRLLDVTQRAQLVVSIRRGRGLDAEDLDSVVLEENEHKLQLIRRSDGQSGCAREGHNSRSRRLSRTGHRPQVSRLCRAQSLARNVLRGAARRVA